VVISSRAVCFNFRTFRTIGIYFILCHCNYTKVSFTTISIVSLLICNLRMKVFIAKLICKFSLVPMIYYSPLDGRFFAERIWVKVLLLLL